MAAFGQPGSHRTSFQNLWPKICLRTAGIENVRVHDLRHTFASYESMATGLLPVIGRLLGHSKITTTQRYAHLDDDLVRAASEAIGATIAGAMVGTGEAEVEIGRTEDAATPSGTSVANHFLSIACSYQLCPLPLMVSEPWPFRSLFEISPVSVRGRRVVDYKGVVPRV